MPSTIAGFPVQEVQFDKVGAVIDQAEVHALQQVITENALTDLLVMSHGWNNNMDEARGLYTAWLTGLAGAPTTSTWNGSRRLGGLAVLWPSKKFDVPDETAGGAAAVGDDHAQLVDHIEQLNDIASEELLATLQQLAPQLESDAAARTSFVHAVVGLLGGPALLDDENAREIPSELFDADGDLLERLGTTLPLDDSTGDAGTGVAGGVADMGNSESGDAMGGAAGLAQFFGGIVSGARNLLNFVTYYTMKGRAGDVGRKGLAPVLTSLPSGLRVHLVGHSFGCRLSTAALIGAPGVANAPTAASMFLVQAAYSHDGLAKNYDNAGSDGYFRTVVDPRHVTGPIAISYSEHDTAVGIAYPLASRIAGQVAAMIGGPNDPYGGMGHNGAQHTPEAVFADMLPVGESYTEFDKQVVNLHAVNFIHSHSDVRGAEVVETLSQVIASTN